MSEDVWYTWHDKKFDSGKYLYHYTDAEKASKILYNKSLRFSPIINTNDTLESKVKISFKNDRGIKDYNKKTLKIKEYMQKYSRLLQLLCFCKDQKKTQKTTSHIYTKEDDLYAVDMAGRGFSLPRMWAQYADNNKGVCFIINKEKFDKELDDRVMIILAEDVRYKSTFDTFSMDAEMMDRLYENINRDENTTMTGHIFLNNHIQYVKYSFFTKFLDWKNENEFRYLIANDNENAIEIKKIDEYLEGVVLGENIDKVQEWIIRQLSKECKCDVKKICFDYNGCRLKD